MQANAQGGLLGSAAHTPASPSPLAPAPAASRCSSSSGNRSRRRVSCSAGAQEADLQARWEALQAELLGDPGRMNSAEFYAVSAWWCWAQAGLARSPMPATATSPLVKGLACKPLLRGVQAVQACVPQAACKHTPAHTRAHTRTRTRTRTHARMDAFTHARHAHMPTDMHAGQGQGGAQAHQR